MLIETGIKNIGKILNNDDYNTIFYCIIRVVNGFYYDPPPPFETYKRIIKYFNEVINDEYLKNLKKFTKLPFLNILDMLLMFDYVQSINWNTKLYKLLDKFDDPITQEHFVKMCNKINSNKKLVVTAIMFGEIIEILSQN